MDGDHFRFWVNQDTAEASLSLKISDIASVTRFSPQNPNATGPEGNSKIELLELNLRHFTSCLKISLNMKINS